MRRVVDLLRPAVGSCIQGLHEWTARGSWLDGDKSGALALFDCRERFGPTKSKFVSNSRTISKHNNWHQSFLFRYCQTRPQLGTAKLVPTRKPLTVCWSAVGGEITFKAPFRIPKTHQLISAVPSTSIWTLNALNIRERRKKGTVLDRHDTTKYIVPDPVVGTWLASPTQVTESGNGQLVEMIASITHRTNGKNVAPFPICWVQFVQHFSCDMRALRAQYVALSSYQMAILTVGYSVVAMPVMDKGQK